MGFGEGLTWLYKPYGYQLIKEHASQNYLSI